MAQQFSSLANVNNSQHPRRAEPNSTSIAEISDRLRKLLALMRDASPSHYAEGKNASDRSDTLSQRLDEISRAIVTDFRDRRLKHQQLLAAIEKLAHQQLIANESHRTQSAKSNLQMTKLDSALQKKLKTLDWRIQNDRTFKSALQLQQRSLQTLDENTARHSHQIFALETKMNEILKRLDTFVLNKGPVSATAETLWQDKFDHSQQNVPKTTDLTPKNWQNALAELFKKAPITQAESSTRQPLNTDAASRLIQQARAQNQRFD